MRDILSKLSAFQDVNGRITEMLDTYHLIKFDLIFHNGFKTELKNNFSVFAQSVSSIHYE